MAAITRNEDVRLGLTAPITRRDMVNGVLAGSGAMLLAPHAQGAGRAGPGGADTFTGYGGVGDYAVSNGNTLGVVQAAHGIRDHRYPDTEPPQAETETFDLVIVGGGPTGLMTAYEYARLTGGKARCLVLENHPVFGGASKQNDFIVEGVRLTGPQAANGFGVPAPGSGGLMDRLWGELGLPRRYEFEAWDSRFTPIRFAQDNYSNMDGLAEGKVDVAYYFDRSDGASRPTWRRNIWANDLAETPFSPKLRRDLIAWRAASGAGDPPAQALDAMSYRHYLEVVKGFDPGVTRVARPHIGLLTGVSPEAVSARAAKVYVRAQQRMDPSFPGGNSAIARYVVKALNPAAIAGEASFADILEQPIDFAALDRPGEATRIRLGATAFAVRHRSDRLVDVDYAQGGRLARVSAKAVVMASGGFVTRRVVADLPADIAAAYGQFVHAPALVVNVALTNWRFLYRLGAAAARWFDDTAMLGFVGNVRQPMLVGGKAPALDPDRPALFTLYMGLYSPGVSDARSQTAENRLRLLATPYTDYERTIRTQMTTMFAATGFEARRDIAGIVLNRWGHARVVQWPGFYFGVDGAPSPREVVAKGFGRIIIAHSELEGAQNYTGAFKHGVRAAQEAVARTAMG
jgi:spermidine dehydrogenase